MMKDKNRGGRTAQGQMGHHMAPRVCQTSVNYDAAGSKPYGSPEADEANRRDDNLYICTYNTRTLREDDDLDRLQEEIKSLKWDIIGLTETKRKGEGLTQQKDGTWLYDAGKTENRPLSKGLAFLINKRLKKYIQKFDTHSERIISCNLKLKRNLTLMIILVYAPTTDYDEDAVEEFYETLEDAMTGAKKGYTIVMGDLNAKIGLKEKTEHSTTTGQFGIGERNARGERLLQFTETNKLTIGNTLFKKGKERYWTWESPDGKTRNMIDYIMTSNRKILSNCEVISKVDIGSDHRMVRGKIKLSKDLLRLEMIKRKKQIRTNLNMLKKHEGIFQLELFNRFEMLAEEEVNIERLGNILEEESTKIHKAEEFITQDIEDEGTTQKKIIEDLDEKRKKLRNKSNKTTTEKVEYCELNKTVKKLRRQRARQRKKEQIINIIESGKGPKGTHQTGKKQLIASMRKENGEITKDREEILKICTNFYEKLYSSSIPTPKDIIKESCDLEEPPPITIKEVENALKKMKHNKAPGPDGITTDLIRIGGTPVTEFLTKIFNKIMTTKQIPKEWKEAKMIIIFKKGDPKDIKNYRPISLLAHTYKIFTRILQNRMEKVLDENQPREQAGFRKGYSTVDHIHTLSQILEKANEYNIPLSVGFIDYEKAFDSIEHFAIFEALRNMGISETYIKIIEDMYTDATAVINIDEMTSTPFNIKRGVRQGDPISPKLFTAALQEIFKKADLNGLGINIDGEELNDLRFADDATLISTSKQDLTSQLNKINNEGKRVGMKIHKGKTKYMTTQEDNNTVKIENVEIERVDNYKYLGQTFYTKYTHKKTIEERIRQGWSSFGRHREILQDKDIPINLKSKVFDQCILPTMTYGCQTWVITKENMRKLRTAQRAMERKMLGIKLKDKIRCTEIRKRTRVTDITKTILKSKAKWTGHIARMKDNRWTIRATEWIPRDRKRSRGRKPRRWRDDIREYFGLTWSSRAKDRQNWKRLSEGYIQQWMDTA